MSLLPYPSRPLFDGTPIEDPQGNKYFAYIYNCIIFALLNICNIAITSKPNNMNRSIKPLILIIAIAIAFALSSCKKDNSIKEPIQVNWVDCIYNPENYEYVNEVADNLGITFEEVTQSQFNDRYKDTFQDSEMQLRYIIPLH